MVKFAKELRVTIAYWISADKCCREALRNSLKAKNIFQISFDITQLSFVSSRSCDIRTKRSF